MTATTIKTYRNTKFTKRDYETSNVVACTGESAPHGAQWVEADESVLNGLTPLWIENGIRFYGYL